MPAMDRTGPLGKGRLGRGMGPCGGGQAWGWGRGHGPGRSGWGGFRSWFGGSDEKDFLEQQKDWLEGRIAEITKRLQDLDETIDE
jgi:hypothetical protein